jgi:hypothetical protein
MAALAAALPVGVASAEKKLPPPPLPLEHTYPSGAFSFRTPEGWTLSEPRPDVMETWGGELGVRFLFRAREDGTDALHEECKSERLAGPMETAPQVRYEYEYIGGPFGDRQALDSAFVVTYDSPVRGHREWRQRTLTVVGGGQSLCAMSYAPVSAWKSAKTRALLDAVLASVTFRK